MIDDCYLKGVTLLLSSYTALLGTVTDSFEYEKNLSIAYESLVNLPHYPPSLSLSPAASLGTASLPLTHSNLTQTYSRTLTKLLQTRIAPSLLALSTYRKTLHTSNKSHRVSFDENDVVTTSETINAILEITVNTLQPLTQWVANLPPELLLRHHLCLVKNDLVSEINKVVSSILKWLSSDTQLNAIIQSPPSSDAVPHTTESIQDVIDEYNIVLNIILMYNNFLSQSHDPDTQPTLPATTAAIVDDLKTAYITLEKMLITKLFEYATSTINTIKPSPEYTTLTIVEDGYIITNNVMSRINCLNSDDTIIRDIHVCLEYNWSSIVNTIHEFTKTNTTTSTATNESNNSDTNNTDNNSSSTPSKSNNNSNTTTSSSTTTTTTPKASLGGFFGGFAAALLDAVDDDLTDAPPSTTTSRYTSTIDKFLLTDDQKFDINVIKANSYNDALRILNTLNYTSTTNKFEESLNQVIKSTIRNELGEPKYVTDVALMDFDAIDAMSNVLPQIVKAFIELPYDTLDERMFEALAARVDKGESFKQLSSSRILTDLRAGAMGSLHDADSAAMVYVAALAGDVATCVYSGVLDGTAGRSRGCNAYSSLLLNKYVRALASLLDVGNSNSIVVSTIVRREMGALNAMLNLLSLDRLNDYHMLYSGRTARDAVEALGSEEEVLKILSCRWDWSDRFKLAAPAGN
jgi:hypothetical protein